MQLPAEVQHAEIMDWWEGEHQRISEALPDRLPALFYHLDQKITQMQIKQLIKKGKFCAETLDPIAVEWIDKLYRELTHEANESLQVSQKLLDEDTKEGEWNYSEMALAGSALAVSVAPAAGVPFFAGGFTTAGTTILGVTFGGGALLALPVFAAAGSLVLLAMGAGTRGRAVDKLKSRIRNEVLQSAEKLVLGDPDNPKQPSLKGTLLDELYAVVLKRLELAK